jgi:hypothetical protein
VPNAAGAAVRVPPPNLSLTNEGDEGEEAVRRSRCAPAVMVLGLILTRIDSSAIVGYLNFSFAVTMRNYLFAPHWAAVVELAGCCVSAAGLVPAISLRPS